MTNRLPSECAEVEEIVAALLQGRGRAVDLQPHLEHIRNCGDCGAIRALAQRSDTGAAGAVPDPGAEYWRDFLPRLETRIRTDKVRPFRRPGVRVAAISIAAALLLAFGWMVFRSSERPDEESRLEARLDEILLAAPEHLDPAKTVLGEILPDESDLVDWIIPDTEDQIEEMESDWFLAAVKIEDVEDLVGPAGNGVVVELDAEGRQEFLRQLQEELNALEEGVPEARRDPGVPTLMEETT
jgi:hypothetical protein